MREQDFDEFHMLLKSVADYYSRQLTESVVSLYWGGLRDLDIAAIRRALNAHMQNPDAGQFMPKVADIRKMLSGTTQDSALVAWSKVDKAIRRVGTYRSVVFDDALIHRVIDDMGGWIMLGGKNEDEWPFIAKEFENRYRGYRMRSERPEYPRMLCGLAEASNSRNGLAIEPPVLIGDVATAKAVLTGGADRGGLKITHAQKAINPPTKQGQEVADFKESEK